jgi:hypothetical protein
MVQETTDMSSPHFSEQNHLIAALPDAVTRVCGCYAVVKKEFDRLLPYKIHGLSATTG